jgi:putative ABC transport system permease protein
MPFVSALRVDLRLAVRNVTREKRRSALGVAAIVFGVVALVLAAGFIEWTFQAMREETINSRLGHIQVARSGYFENGAADPFAFLLAGTDPMLRTIEAIPGVASVAPRLALSGLASHGDATLSFIAEGIDAAQEQRLKRMPDITAGEALPPDDSESVIVGEGLASNLGVKVGDLLVLVANRERGGINAIEVRVRGLFSTISKAYDDTALRLPIQAARQLLGVSGAHTWVVMLDETSRTAAVTARLRKDLAGRDLEVVPWYDAADFYNKTVVLFSKQVGVLKVIIALIVVLSISNTMMMGVVERTGEIGTRMALGHTRARILRQFMSEGLVLGIIGATVGVLAAFALAHVVSAIGIPMPPPPGRARGFVGEILVTWPLVLDAVALAIGTTVVASLYPAWRASRMTIVDALRHGR